MLKLAAAEDVQRGHFINIDVNHIGLFDIFVKLE